MSTCDRLLFVSPSALPLQPRNFAVARCARRGAHPTVATAQSAGHEHPALNLYNTQSKRKERFSTVEEGVVRFYSCGPTVYDSAHIGNFRAFLTYDVIKRWLLCLGYDVRHVLNLTDIDDKIIDRMQLLSVSLEALTQKYADAFFADLALLNILPATHYPRATEYIAEMEQMIEGLRAKGHAYTQAGTTWFDVGSFAPYGQLANLEERQNQPRDAEVHEKRDPRDFALWKAWKPADGDVKWASTLGEGRPGWHIECSSMAMKLLGPELDIHGGGVDLAFPHHENETAQSEAYTGKRYVRFWLHNGFVNVDNEKMSKSLGNFRTLRDIVQRRVDARAFRYLVVTSHYRSALAFTAQCMDAARSAVRRLDALRSNLQQASGDGGAHEMATVVQKARTDFTNGMNDDLNTPRAAAAMFSLVNAAEKMLKRGEVGSDAAWAALDCLDDFDKVFGVNYVPDVEEEEVAPDIIPIDILSLLDERNAARKMKDYQLADSLRDRISKAGYAIVDTPQGAVLEPIRK